MRKFVFITTLVLVAAAAGFFWWRYLFVFGEGVKAGELNFVVRKGYLFKTWEGKLIQTGYKSKAPGTVQSNEFEFSIENAVIAEQLKLSSGKVVELGYKEYLNVLPWRGNSKYVVDTIIEIIDQPMNNSAY